MKFGKQNNFKHYIHAKPVIGILLIIVVLLLLSVYKRFGIEREMYNRKNMSEVELLKLQDKKTQLEERVNYLEGDRGVEEEIRENFDVAKKGEQVIILVGDDETPLETVTTSDESHHQWYQFWQ